MNMTRLGQDNVKSKLFAPVKLPFERLKVNSDKAVFARFDPVFGDRQRPFCARDDLKLVLTAKYK